MIDRMDTTTPQLLTTRDLAQRMQCSERHVRDLAAAGLIPSPIRLGRLVRWSPAVIDRWILDPCGRIAPADPPSSNGEAGR